MLDDDTLLGFITAAAVDARNTIFDVYSADCKFGYDPGLTDESLQTLDIIDDFLMEATSEDGWDLVDEYRDGELL